jgi:hypothetical protein
MEESMCTHDWEVLDPEPGIYEVHELSSCAKEFRTHFEFLSEKEIEQNYIIANARRDYYYIKPVANRICLLCGERDYAVQRAKDAIYKQEREEAEAEEARRIAAARAEEIANLRAAKARQMWDAKGE